METLATGKIFDEAELAIAIEVLAKFGNTDLIRSSVFHDFLWESYQQGISNDCETPGIFIEMCLEVFMLDKQGSRK